MIASLNGTILERDQARLVVEAAGVGYEVFVPATVTDGLSASAETVKLHIRLIWRDDGPSLYGFTEAWEKRLFDLMLSVSGVGPKAALGLIGALGSDQLAQTIALGDSKRLQRVPGIGAKTAQRIVLELGDKVASAAFERRIDRVTIVGSTAPIGHHADDAIDALITMGFKSPEARSAVDQALSTLGADAQVEALIKEALKKVKTKA